MKFKFEDYKGNYVMHCKTEDEANDFCRVMHEDGRNWCSGASYLDKNEYWCYGELTCYSFNDHTYCNVEHFKNSHHILEWEDFMDKKFNIKDLKTGMVVEIVKGTKYIVGESDKDGLILSNSGGWLSVNDYTSDFKLKKYPDFDIIKVYSRKNVNVDISAIDFIGRDLLWERKHKTILTMDEIAYEFGIDVEDLEIKK